MKLVIVAAAGLVLATGACAPPADSAARAETGSPPGQVEDRTADIRGTQREPSAIVEELVVGLTTFGYELHQAFADPGDNTVFSPLSIGLAFGMARAGAGGTTAEEIDAVFGFGEDVHAAFHTLDQSLGTHSGPPPPPPDPEEERDALQEPRQPPIVAIANGMFAQEGLHLEEPFSETLATDYGVSVHTVDFEQTEATKALIDAWVAEQTAERIEALFARVDPSWLLVLANAVYLKAEWATTFTRHPVTEEAFARMDGTDVDVPTMRRFDWMPYAAGDGWQAVQLAYAEGDLAMRVIVPDDIRDPGKLLAPDVLAEVEAGLGDTLVDLRLPQWDFDTELALVPLLQELGMNMPFVGGAADFSAITADADLFIGEAIHRATITVDEWGTEAAAVTGMAFPTSGHVGSEVIVRADHPFAFTIVHTPTGAPLFSGTVSNPDPG